jgi:putative YhdH/YhfP family quinone oxidoreductase
MRAVRMYATGGPEVLKIEDIATPEPGRNEVLIRLRVAAVNRTDLLLREGTMPLAKGLPHTLGMDGAGAVIRGSAGGDARPGDRVLVSGDTLGRVREGTYAEYVLAPNALVLPLPKELRLEDAVGLGMAALAAWQGLIDRADIQPGQTVLIHAASSGVGVIAVQIAKLMGAHVIATTGSDAKADLALQLGADHVLNYSKHDFVAPVKRLTRTRGVDVVLDLVGGTVLSRSLECLAPNGTVVAMGMLGGSAVEVNLQHLVPRGVRLLGLNAGALPPYQAADRYRQMLDLVLRQRLFPVIDRILPLSDAAAAHRILTGRQHFGKILLKT